MIINTNNTENIVQTTRPESHVWDLKCSIPPNVGSGKNEFSKGIQSKEADCYLFNKITGEVRFLAQESILVSDFKKGQGQIVAPYLTLIEFK